jgi:hypothetical protein
MAGALSVSSLEQDQNPWVESIVTAATQLFGAKGSRGTFMFMRAPIKERRIWWPLGTRLTVT